MKEAEVARSLNDALRANQSELQERLRAAEAASAAALASRDAKIQARRPLGLPGRALFPASVHETLAPSLLARWR